MESPSNTLPPLRQDLQLQRGAPSLNGQATWLIYDPVRHKYFSVSERVYQLVSLWARMSSEDLAEYASDILGDDIDAEEINSMLTFFASNNLTDTPASDDPNFYARQTEASRQNIFSKALHSYLFFRIPIWRPEAFLTATYPFIRPLFSPAAVYVYLVSLFIGLYFVSRQWDAFSSTFLYFFTLDGMVMYALSLVFIKTLHEMGHAYMAHRYGVRVNTMGVAFLVMLPVLYTDVTDAWSLRSRKQKLMIDGAGMFVELAIAAIATLFWVFLPDGSIRSAAFLLATTSWILSVFVNLNPLMRFDGYYILADAWGMPNLQPRAFAQARWWLREMLFDLKEEPPEPFSRKTRALLNLYAFSTWIYRFFLFIGIALVVYHMFFKVLGIALFVVEILFFILRPIWGELKEWWKIRSKINRTRRTIFTACVTASIFLALVIPWNGTVRVPAISTAEIDFVIYSEQAAQLRKINVIEGQDVKKGEVLLTLVAPRLVQKITQTNKKINLLKARIARTAGDQTDLSSYQVLRRQLNSENERLLGLKREKMRMQIRAPENGQIRDMDPALHIGRWVNQNAPLLRIVGRERSYVKGYIKEDISWRLKEGQKGVFVADDPMIPPYDIILKNIAPTGSSTLDNFYLASVYGGPIAVERKQKDRLRMTAGQHMLQMTSDMPPGRKVLRGVVLLNGQAESFLGAVWRQIMKVLVREASI